MHISYLYILLIICSKAAKNVSTFHRAYLLNIILGLNFTYGFDEYADAVYKNTKYT